MNFRGIRPEQQAALDTQVDILLSKVTNPTTRSEIRERLNSNDSGVQLTALIRLLNVGTWPASQQGV